MANNNDSPAPPDWQALVFEPAWLERLDAMTLRRFTDPVLAEEASTYVLERLSADDWARCRDFSGQSKPTTYLFSISSNLVEEFARKRFGRIRPPRWLQRQGELWISLWRRLCLDRQPVQAVIDQFHALRDCAEAFLQDAIRLIRARIPDCGQAAPRSVELPDDSLTDVPPETHHDRQHYEETALLISWVLNGEDGHLMSMQANAAQRTRLAARFETFADRLRLTPEQRLVLQLVYRDGMNLASAARRLGMPAHKPGRILKKALATIERALRESCIELDSLHEHLQARAADT